MWTVVNWNEAKWHFVLKKATFSVLIPPNAHFELMLYRNLSGRRQLSTESVENLQSCTDANRMPHLWTISKKNFVQFADEPFWFHQFWTPVENFVLVFPNLNSNSGEHEGYQKSCLGWVLNLKLDCFAS
jgi:hypothetical protein